MSNHSEDISLVVSTDDENLSAVILADEIVPMKIVSDEEVEQIVPMEVRTDESVSLQIRSEEPPIPLHVNEFGSSGTFDYRELFNKPSINGTELVTNYDEIDPTVHEWAKEPRKPDYTYQEVGAVGEDNEMPFADILEAWRFVFGN